MHHNVLRVYKRKLSIRSITKTYEVLQGGCNDLTYPMMSLQFFINDAYRVNWSFRERPVNINVRIEGKIIEKSVM